MLKQWIVVVGAMLAVGCASADEASLKKAIEATFPSAKVQRITKTPFSGLYEVYVNGEIVYTDEKFSFMLAEGRLIDTKTRKDLTSERLEDLSRVDFKSLPLDQAIKVVKGDGSRKLVVFSDPDCPFCKRLEKQELIGIDNVTIYTFLFPLDQLHPDAASKSHAIWCAPDRVKAWQDWVLNGQLAKKAAGCEAPLDKIEALAASLGIKSTPMLIFGDGRRLAGAYPAKDIERALDAAKGR